ncbi:uncharacterized protein KY384_000452 [Bacidia gigantensis]|uniref:uncharacterized protein n=1 Tax=Bacidia gigantensis TaxID=2732470 RepID=UPI001D03E583|nr:uncharacterized protein KY384_000452 [Bacidia gigantensis]KAG8525692.1 hypothetical protein KY384_000452 [Bacidia gigantensis]
MSAVDSVSDAMANTTISPPPLEELITLLVKLGGCHELMWYSENVSIPTNPRTTRPVGYAFVDLTTADEASKAIGELSGKTVLDRKVSVQEARKPETAEEKAAKTETGEVEVHATPMFRDSPKEGEEALADTTNEAAPVTNGATTTNGVTKPAAAAAQPRQRGPPEDGIPSSTKIMVANLPYEMSEDKLKDLFAAYSPSAAKIALRPIPRFMIAKLKARGEPRKGRGFGFVSLGSEELQQKAVSEMNGKEVEGREIAVKVAIDSPGKEDVDPEAAGTAPLTENGVVQANDPPAA